MNVSDGLEFFALADRLKFSEHKGKACSANKCRIRESDLRRCNHLQHKPKAV